MTKRSEHLLFACIAGCKKIFIRLFDADLPLPPHQNVWTVYTVIHNEWSPYRLLQPHQNVWTIHRRAQLYIMNDPLTGCYSRIKMFEQGTHTCTVIHNECLPDDTASSKCLNSVHRRAQLYIMNDPVLLSTPPPKSSPAVKSSFTW